MTINPKTIEAAGDAGPVGLALPAPYLLFLGDVTNVAYAKTALGLHDWAGERCIGEFALPEATVTTGLPAMRPADALLAGAKSLVIGIANEGGRIPASWIPALVEAIEAGLDIVSGMHVRLASVPAVREAAERCGRALIDVRTPPPGIPIGSGRKRSGKRLLTVGTDCALGKKYTALALTRALQDRGIEADFRATGQTGIMISGSGMPMDAVVSDFLSGAAEMISPDAADDHWDVIEGQGSLYHPGFAGVSLGLLHGSQPDVFVVCHDPTRRNIVGLPGLPVPSLTELIDLTVTLGRRTNPAIRCGGIALNTSALSPSEAAAAIAGTADALMLPTADPIRGGEAFDRLVDSASPDMAGEARRDGPTWFQRYLLPGLAFKALVIGGGYATGREVAEFFLPSGPWGGLAAIALATILFSAGCALTFLFALATRSLDYQSFFKALLGRGWVAWEVTYILFVILILAVYGAAAGEIGVALFGLPTVAGTLLLMAGIILAVMYGNKSVERLFEWVSYLLYGVYALFFVLAFSSFGGRIVDAFGTPAPSDGWALSGATYFSYNVIGAIVVLPVVRHFTGRRDAIIAGAICGPLMMLPALLFFTAAVAFHPAISDATLPSDFLLQRLGMPWFHYLFQLMVFSALLESGASAVHAFNERVDKTWQRRRGVPLGPRRRFVLALVLLVLCMFLASAVGLVDLIGSGYRLLAFILLAIFVVPLATIGLARILKKPAPGDDDVPQTAS